MYFHYVSVGHKAFLGKFVVRKKKHSEAHTGGLADGAVRGTAASQEEICEPTPLTSQLPASCRQQEVGTNC